MDKYFLFDTETGGKIAGHHTLLTLHGMVLDDNLSILDTIGLIMRPVDGRTYSVTAEALSVNKIDLIAHHKRAIDLERAKVLMNDFLVKHAWSGDKLTPAGHNVSFDIAFLRANLVPGWDDFRYFTYRTMDTSTIALFLQQVGKLPKSLKISLSSLVKHFDIHIDTTTMHDSRVDAEATRLVLQRLITLTNGEHSK